MESNTYKSLEELKEKAKNRIEDAKEKYAPSTIFIPIAAEMSKYLF